MLAAWGAGRVWRKRRAAPAHPRQCQTLDQFIGLDRLDPGLNRFIGSDKRTQAGAVAAELAQRAPSGEIEAARGRAQPAEPHDVRFAQTQQRQWRRIPRAPLS